MKFLFVSVAILLGLVHLPTDKSQALQPSTSAVPIGCGPQGPFRLRPDENGKFINPLPGWGNHSYTISTRSDSAQFYFNQGLNMYYSYHMREAMVSFREASRFDSTAAMPYWGQALALGPYYNATYSYSQSPLLPDLLRKMKNFPAGTAAEQILINAMDQRYAAAGDTTGWRTLNQRYADLLRKAVLSSPDDNDLKMLFVDAVMLNHAWNFWNNDGSPKEWTPALVELCEQVLLRDKNHPAAMHYYIHITEASRKPEVALDAARRLGGLMPGVAHMVHMSSHEYERNSLFPEGVQSNKRADAALKKYDLLAPQLGLVKASPHYFAVQAYCALSGGLQAEAGRVALQTRAAVSPDATKLYDQYLYMFPELAMVRLGQWAGILSRAGSPDSSWIYAGLLHHFARGMAHANTGQLDSAAWHLSKIEGALDHPSLLLRRMPFNTYLEAGKIAFQILESVLQYQKGDTDGAITAISKAIEVEDKMVYTEPRDWMLPARQYLGYYLEVKKDYTAAAKVYREDLIWNPGNGWSDLGLANALRHGSKQKGLRKKRSLEGFRDAENIPAASVHLRFREPK